MQQSGYFTLKSFNEFNDSNDSRSHGGTVIVRIKKVSVHTE